MPEPIKTKQAGWEEKEAMESRSFPAALHGAAFVSSEGKVYRLFAEDESSSLGETLQFDRFEYEPPPAENREDHPIFPMTLRFFSDSQTETDEKNADSFDGSLPSTLSLDEALRRLRAVEGTWGRRSEEPSVRIFDSMSQSATVRSRRVLGKAQPSEDPAPTDRQHTIPLFDAAQPCRPPKTVSVQETRTDQPKNLGGPSRQNASVAAKPIQTSEFRAAATRSTEISFEILEKPAANVPWQAVAARLETEKKSEPQQETSEPTLEKTPSNEFLFRERPVIEKQRTCTLDGSVVELRVDNDDRQTPASPIPLIHVVMPPPRRRPRFVPRKESMRPRFEEERPEHLTPTTLTAVEEETSASETKTLETASESFETAAVQEILVEEKSAVVEEPFVVTTVVEEWEPAESVPDETAFEMGEPLKLRSISFRWPDVCDALKKKADTQIGSLADYLVALKEHGRKTICFHGFFPAEGCTTLLLCAVRELTDRGFSVLLVDGNVRHPELPMLLDVPKPTKNDELLSLADHRLELLSLTGKTPERSKQVGLLKNSYDFILIDAGSLTEGEPSEKTLFWQETAADGVMLVINTKNRQPVNLEAVDGRLRQHGIELLGVSENYV